jgi:hypothetical protein
LGLATPRARARPLPDGAPRWEVGAALLPRGDLLAVQQLLIKGLFRPETELTAVKVRIPKSLLQTGLPALLVMFSILSLRVAAKDGPKERFGGTAAQQLLIKSLFLSETELMAPKVWILKSSLQVVLFMYHHHDIGFIPRPVAIGLGLRQLELREC